MTKERRMRAMQRQVRRLQSRLNALERLGNRYSWARLAIFGTGIAISGLLYFLGYPQLFGVVLIVAILAFGIAIRYHRRIDRSIARHQIWRDLKAAQIARMQLDWEHLPPSVLRQQGALGLDLDLVGECSLHRLLNTAQSDAGSRRLGEWLTTSKPDPGRIAGRQQLVRELAPLSLFREKLILNGKLASRTGEQWHSDRLLAWLRHSTRSASLRNWLMLLGLLAALNITLFLSNVLGLIPPIWQATLLLYVVLFLAKSRELGKPFREAAQLRDALEQLVAVFQQLETFGYRNTPQLKALCAPFLSPGQRPSQHLARINRIVNATGIRGNPVIWFILNVAVPWDFYFAHRLSRAKEAIGERLSVWMDVWFELEAANSLANLAYLNPAYTFPNIVTMDSLAQPKVFEARELGHPLIPDAERVCNGFTIDALGEIDLITGSNMSGKSTFLRTVGINLMLAYAGGPVNAQYLHTIPFRVFTCIRVSDSVTNGVSYFYAEVKCLKALLSELKDKAPLPLIYFIDEIFRGTNNRERLIGSRAYIRELAGKSGVGLLATHDLELVGLADEIPGIKNHHFSDAVIDGRMVFDYALRPGPSPTTNALKIMRMEGLPT